MFVAEDLSHGHHKSRREDEGGRAATYCLRGLRVFLGGFFRQPGDRAHDALPVLIVRNCKSKCIWNHPVPSKGVVHLYLARALTADLVFMVYKRIVLKSDQEPSIIALCDAVKNGWHGEIVPEASPKSESKSNGEVECAVQSVHGLPGTLKDFLEQKSGIALESRSPLLAWLVEHCSNLLLLFHNGEHCLRAFEGQTLEN